MWTAVLVFGLTLLTEMARTLNVRWTADHRVYPALCASSTVTLLGFAAIVLCIQDIPSLCPAYFLGDLCGTWIALRFLLVKSSGTKSKPMTTSAVPEEPGCTLCLESLPNRP